MTSIDLIQGNYAPFFVIEGYPNLIRSNQFWGTDKKQLAVSENGKVFRMSLSNRGYNDKFTIDADGNVILTYVCGKREEMQRQQKNKFGDEVFVELGDRSLRRERHAIFKGVFIGIRDHVDRKADGTEELVSHSHIRLDSYFLREFGEEVNLNTLCVSSLEPFRRPFTTTPEHLFIDTESAPPSDGRKHDAFPVLQYSFIRTDATFERAISLGTEYIKYPPSCAKKIGNDESSSILKVPIECLESGVDVHDALTILVKQFERVRDTDGCVIAHNVQHDIAQICKTAELVQFELPQTCRYGSLIP